MCDAASDTSESETLVVDLRIRSIWQDRVYAIFYVQVVDMDAPSF